MEETVKPRRPWIAALFSLIVPGLGQFYDGRPLRALVFFGGPLVLFFALLLAGLPGTFPGLIVLVALVVILRLWAVWDAAVLARRNQEYVLKPYNQWYAYLAVILAVFLVPTETLREHIHLPARTFAIPTGSMEPALRQGDHVYAAMTSDHSAGPKRGELVIYTSPETQVQKLSRVIGLPGEQIEVREKVVYINGKRLEDPWGQHLDPHVFTGMEVPRDNMLPIEIPADAVFLMGDNRDGSHDSRFSGPVPLSNLQGRPLYIYWAADKSRIGTSPQ